MRKSLAIAILFVVFILWRSLRNLDFSSHEQSHLRSSVPFPVQNCRGVSTDEAENRSESLIAFNESMSVDHKVLILTKRPSMIKTLLPVLEANRISYDLHYLVGADRDVLPSFAVENVGKYAGIIFTSLSDYFSLSSWNKLLLDNYCRSFTVGMVLFNHEEGKTSQISDGLPFKVHTDIRQFKTYRVNRNATILRLLKADKVLESDERKDVIKWSVFIPKNDKLLLKEFEVVSSSSFSETLPRYLHGNVTRTRFPVNPEDFPVVIHDLGVRDGVHRVYFGADLTFWPHKLLFLDALGFVSSRILEKPLDRWIMVDIDDVFVGKEGIRLNKEDVKALVFTQRKLQKVVPGFHFNLGFSGKHFLHGNSVEDEGDQEILDNAKEFWWFGHAWSHKQPHLIETLEDLQNRMQLNIEFAKEHSIPLEMSYSVAPHHSGVYPAHNVLYEAWSKVLGVKVTSTEEYPHLRPAWKRRGFIYRDIMVLPRQTCGLFTHTLFLEQYPKGKETLLKSIYGGELFQLFVSNPINIFMTHLPNYGSDRLALYTFTNVIKFVQCWTNLRIMTVPPLEMANKYFQLYPSEKSPVWQNPCKDPRHKLIWPARKSCNRLPSFVIVGPQKTGTTALHMFLSVHPEILRNKDNAKSYEETQFFSSINYYKGLDWYMDFFPDVSENSSTVVFEKTANYFDSSRAPMRFHALLPDAKIIVILNDPIRRAYSWFQHVRFHKSKVANSIDFIDLLTYGNLTDEVGKLRKRCLIPGLYAHHLERWMFYFPSSQILTIDGEQLRQDPVQVMEQVQMFIGVKTIIDYGARIRYNERKGFYCVVGERNGSNCLGKSKGRKYPPMTDSAVEYLRQYYREPNRQLVELLHKIRQPLPKWLSIQR